ncbi:MAG: BatD family protein [Polyangiales bacterium]
MKPWAAALSVALGVMPSTAAAVVRVRLELDNPRPTAGQSFHIVYGISAQNENRPLQATSLSLPGLQVLANPSPPSTDGFGMFGGGAGVQMTMETNVEYIVVAERPGRYTIQNAAVIDRSTGQVVARHPPLTVVVGRPDPNAPQVQPQPQPMPGFPPIPGFPPMPGFPGFPQEPPPPPVYQGPDVPPEGQLTGAVFDPNGFLRVLVSDPAPYVGQPVEYRAWAYLPAYDAGCEPLREPTVTGFWSDNLLRQSNVCAQRWIPVSVNGNNMGAGMIRHLALYPTRPGESEIGPLEMNFEFILGDSFFGQRRQVHLRSPSITVNVRDTPAEGRPRDYVPGTIGPLTLDAHFDRRQVTAGETVTLTIRAQGNGYIGSVTFPPLPTVDGLRMLTPTSRLLPRRSDDPLHATREDTVAVIPERPGSFSLGEWSIPYFDPNSHRYLRATVTLPTLEVTGAAVTRDDDGSHDDPTIALDPFDPGASLAPHRAVFTTGLRVWSAVLAPGTGLALFSLVGALRRLRARRREEDEDLSRNDPERLLASAENSLRAGRTAEALASLGRAISLARKEIDDDALRDAQAEVDTMRFADAEGVAPERVRELVSQLRAALARATEAS